MRRALAALPLLVLPLFALAACSAPSSSAGAVTVSSTKDACTVGAATLAAGTHTFAVSNDGDDVTEFYVYGTGDSIVAEVESIAPGASRELVAQLAEGRYELACKPGQKGDGIRSALTVTAGSATPTDPRLATAVTGYTAYVQQQVALLVPATAAFTAAVEAGDVARAKSLYAASRIPWERIEPVAESFGDLDPRVDAREGDVEPGQVWTGWHKLEKDLWVTGTTDPATARRLLADIKELQAKVATVALTPSQLGNGAKELLDEVATGKVTGEEERYSRIDLVDFQANVEGAQQAYQALRPVAADRDAALATTLDTRFADVLSALAVHGSGTTFTSYDALTPAQVRGLAAKVDALSEPLSRLTAVVLR